jgi:DNA-directed RNA polymerase subunit RPC12/RpoP
MVPELTVCEQCGRTVIVLSWAPVYEDSVQLTEADESHTLSIDCKIDCPACGTRIQSIVPSINGEPA